MTMRKQTHNSRRKGGDRPVYKLSYDIHASPQHVRETIVAYTRNDRRNGSYKAFDGMCTESEFELSPVVSIWDAKAFWYAATIRVRIERRENGSRVRVNVSTPERVVLPVTSFAFTFLLVLASVCQTGHWFIALLILVLGMICGRVLWNFVEDSRVQAQNWIEFLCEKAELLAAERR